MFGRLNTPIKLKSCFLSTSVKVDKQKKASSTQWLKRHTKDPYVKLAHLEDYRARSAFKLIEINKSHRLLKKGMAIVECGAAPGAWTQVATQEVGSSGMVIACDLLR